MNNLILLDTYIRDHWKKKDARLYRTLRLMDNVEFWVLDEDEEFSDKISGLGNLLSNAKQDQIESCIGSLITVIAYTSSSKAIRIVNWIEEEYPDLFQKMMSSVHSHPYPKSAKLFLTRLKTLKNLDLISRIFNPDRSQRINSWLKTLSLQGVNE